MLVTKIQKFSTKDGPGIRTTVFFKGCPLRCKWCHNPETQNFRNELFFTKRWCVSCGACVEACPNGCHVLGDEHLFVPTKCEGCGKCADACITGACELCSKEMTVDEIVSVVLDDKAFYGETGGVTLSGGEPLVVKETPIILEKLKSFGISTCIETSCSGNHDITVSAAKLCDVIYIDIKDGDRDRHIENVGIDPSVVFENAKLIDENTGGKIIIRAIMVKDVNMDDKNYLHIAEVFKSLKHCDSVELLPYHAYGGGKNVQLGYLDNGHKEWIPEPSDIEAARSRLLELGVKVAL